MGGVAVLRCERLVGMEVAIRDYRPADEERVVALSLRSWAPVFASLERVLGAEIFGLLHPYWSTDQDRAVRAVLADPAMRIWVAEVSRGVVGFAAAKLVDPDRLLGEVCMLAVDPVAQHQGLGTALTEEAMAWLRSLGTLVAMVDTGGDPGHAPARRVYDKAGYSPLPVARYFKAL